MAVIDQDEINRAVWAASEAFRGGREQWQSRDFFLIILFAKYLSEFWKNLMHRYEVECSGDPERIAHRLRRARFMMPEVEQRDAGGVCVIECFPADFDSMYARRERYDIGAVIDATLSTLEAANREKLTCIFRGISFNNDETLGPTKERNERLRKLLQALAALDLGPPEGRCAVLARTYLYLIERFNADAGKKSADKADANATRSSNVRAIEATTPFHVARLVAALLAPQLGHRICDPVCGSGGLLIAAAQAVGGRNYALYGQERSNAVLALARMNMLIHEFDNARLEWGDTLRSPMLIEQDRLMQFDIVLASLPLSLSKWQAEDAPSDLYARHWRGTPPKNRTDYAFISHLIESAVPQQGRVAVIVPHGVLFNVGAEGRIRRRLIEENLLDAVIGLPANLFPNAASPMAVMLFDRAREPGGAREHVRDVLFVDAGVGLPTGKSRIMLSDDQVAHIVALYRAWQSSGRSAHLASPAELVASDFNLNLAGYLGPSRDSGKLDLGAALSEICTREHQLAEARAEIQRQLQAFHR
jgi:type I restriction enzyme M protein